MKKLAAPLDSDAYIARVGEPGRSALLKVRASLRAIVPAGTVETMSYGMPVFTYDGKPLVWYAAFSHHCSLFTGSSVVDALSKDLARFKTLRGTIQFAPESPPSATLLKKLVRARLADNERKAGRASAVQRD